MSTVALAVTVVTDIHRVPTMAMDTAMEIQAATSSVGSLG